jgi:hypothetical protein
MSESTNQAISPSPTLSQFHYTPLKKPKEDLRLIRIDHGQENEKLRCIMHTYASDQWRYMTYQALSYTWGDGTRKAPISINGHDFLVTTNLEDALRHLRCSTHSESTMQVPFWIDAICVNQEDSNERDAQARRMKSIYERAARVIIWLGKYNEPTDETLCLDLSRWHIDGVEENSEAMARSALVLAVLLKEEGDLRQRQKFQSPDILMRLEDCVHTENLQVWVQLWRLFHRPWFERLWIIQELAVSRKAIVRWGNLQAPWPTLEKAAQFILRPGEVVLTPHIRRLFPLLGAHRITQVALKSMYNFDTRNVLTILHSTQNNKCSDPRDRLYAIQGIVDDNQDIEIDYSIPVQQVYRDWAEKRMKRTWTLQIFSACADSSGRGDLPSWVPDLRRPFGQDKPIWIATQALGSMSWGLGARQVRPDLLCRELRFSEDGLKIHLSGKQAGTIDNMTSVGDAVTDLPDPTDLKSRLRQILAEWEAVLYSPSKRSGDESLSPIGFKESVLRSFYPWLIDHNNLSMPYDIWRGDNRSRHSLEEYVNSGDWDMSRHEVALKEFERHLFPRVHGCQMFTIEAGRTGIVAGNCGTKVGDELWLVSGGLSAFVLRRVNEVEHRLISPCYLFAMMFAADIKLEWQNVVLV